MLKACTRHSGRTKATLANRFSQECLGIQRSPRSWLPRITDFDFPLAIVTFQAPLWPTGGHALFFGNFSLLVYLRRLTHVRTSAPDSRCPSACCRPAALRLPSTPASDSPELEHWSCSFQNGWRKILERGRHRACGVAACWHT